MCRQGSPVMTMFKIRCSHWLCPTCRKLKKVRPVKTYFCCNWVKDIKAEPLNKSPNVVMPPSRHSLNTGSSTPGGKSGFPWLKVRGDVNLVQPSIDLANFHALSVFRTIGFVHSFFAKAVSMRNNRFWSGQLHWAASISSHVEDWSSFSHSATNLKCAATWYHLTFGRSKPPAAFGNCNFANFYSK